MTCRTFLRLSLASVFTFVLATTAFAQPGPPPGGPMGFHGEHGGDRMHGDHFGPGGMWWKNPELVTKLGLTTDQQKKIDDIFVQSRMKLIDLKAALEKEEVLLDPLMNANPFESAKALTQIDKIADTRAELEKANAAMLLNIRGVLTAAQWTTLQASQHRRGEMMRKGPDGGRGPQGGRGQWGHGRPGGPGAPSGPTSSTPPPPPSDDDLDLQ